MPEMRACVNHVSKRKMAFIMDGANDLTFLGSYRGFLWDRVSTPAES